MNICKSILLVGLLVWNSAFAGSGAKNEAATVPDSGPCTEIDLRTATCPDGRPRMPALRNQGETNYCFAYSLADFYSFTGCRNYSGLSTGLQANLKYMSENPNPRNTSEELNTGMPTAGANGLIQRAGGICLEEDFPSNRQEIMSEERYTRFLRSIWSQRRETNPLRCRIQEVPQIEFTTLERPLDRATERNALDRQREIMNAVNVSLERNSPVIMNYNPAILDDRNLAADPRSGHVSMVVGRKIIGGVCQYLVRDPTPVQSTAWTLDNGYVWIPRTHLVPHMSEVSTGRETTPFCPPTQSP